MDSLEHKLFSSPLLGTERKKHKYLLRIPLKKGSYRYLYTQDQVNAYRNKAKNVKNAVSDKVSDLAKKGSSKVSEGTKSLKDFEKKFKYLLKVKISDKNFRYFYNQKDVDAFLEGKLGAPIVEISDYYRDISTELSQTNRRIREENSQNLTRLEDLKIKRKNAMNRNKSLENLTISILDMDKSMVKNDRLLPKSLKEKKIHDLNKKKANAMKMTIDNNRASELDYHRSVIQLNKEHEQTLEFLNRKKNNLQARDAARRREDFLADAPVRSKAAFSKEVSFPKDLIPKKGPFSKKVNIYEEEKIKAKYLADLNYENAIADEYVKTTVAVTPGYKVYHDPEAYPLYRETKDNSNIVNVKKINDSQEQLKTIPRLTEKESKDTAQEIVNPEYDPKRVETYTNCQNCTTAYVMRRMGYDVEARLRDDDYGGTVVHTNFRFNGAVSLGQTKSETSVEATEKLTKQLKSFGEGSYGELAVWWASGSGGHSMVWSVEGGEVVIRDTQVGAIYKKDGITDLLEYTEYYSDNGIVVTRLDNTVPDDDVFKAVKKRGG